jgi:hypothetical protein
MKQSADAIYLTEVVAIIAARFNDRRQAGPIDGHARPPLPMPPAGIRPAQHSGDAVAGDRPSQHVTAAFTGHGQQLRW